MRIPRKVSLLDLVPFLYIRPEDYVNGKFASIDCTMAQAHSGAYNVYWQLHILPRPLWGWVDVTMRYSREGGS